MPSRRSNRLVPRVARSTDKGLALAFAAAFALLAMASPVAESATAVLQLTPSANPSTIVPGGSGTVVLTLRNAGDTLAFTIETYVVRTQGPIVVNETGNVNLGGLGPGVTTVLSPFTFTVDRDAPPGIYRIEGSISFSYLDGGVTRFNSFSYSVAIVVRPAANLVVASLTPDRFPLGVEIPTVIRVANLGGSEYLSVAGLWTTTQNTILPLGGSNRFQIASVPAGGFVDVPVRVAASTQAAPGLYGISFQLNYLDTAGNVYNSTSTVGVLLGSVGASDVSVHVQNLSRSELTLVVTNIGIQPLTGIQVRLLPQDGLDLDASELIVVGNLLPGEFRTAIYDIRRTANNGTALAEVQYTDSLGQRRTTSTPLSLDEDGGGSGFSTAFAVILTAVVILAVQALLVVGWVYRRRAKEKRKQQEAKDEADFADLARAVEKDTEDLRR
jgi:hypothetical protein